MPGGIIQLVANSGQQDTWINKDPQITFFKKIYRRHTPFATELVPIRFKNNLDFSGSGNATLLSQGDLVHRVFFVCDIPELMAMFLNTKSQDISQLINSLQLSDQNFSNQIKKYANNQYVEFDQILNLIEETLDSYDAEQQNRLNILTSMENYTDPMGTEGLINKFLGPNENTALETDCIHPCKKIIIARKNSTDPNNFMSLKMDLADKWLSEKKEYYLVYELVKFIYLLEKPILENVPPINDLANTLLYSNIFNNMIPNKEILLMHYLKKFSTIDDITDKNNELMKNFGNHQYLNSIFQGSGNLTQNQNLLDLDTYNLLKQIENQTDIVQNVFCGSCRSLNSILRIEFHDFGPGFYYILNSYNSIINVVKSLASTTPIVIAKAFGLNASANIYLDRNAQLLKPTQYPTIIDPNFKANFLLNVNHVEKPIEDNTFTPIDYVDTNDEIYPNEYMNSYLKFFNAQSNLMFGNVKKSMDILFEAYRRNLFSSTDKLFYNNSPPLSNIYSYFVPEAGFIDNGSQRINNVFNANIWFFYFFKYLDSLNENNFTNYVNNHTNIAMSINGILLMKSLLALLKINIEYHMNEISYLLNDLYASSPSTDPTDTMKNYVPIAYNSVINGIDIHNSLLAITMIFHRNQVPTILEMFQFIYYFIDNIGIDQINNYLDANIAYMDPSEIMRIRTTVKLFYCNIFKYFMDVYDSFKFEAPANFSTDAYDKNSDTAIKQYVKYFLTGTNAILPTTERQIPLKSTIAQMEFYFVSEMINMRQTEKLYHNILFNKDLISSTVGSTSAELVDMISKTLFGINNDYTIDLS